jgi:wyosine [tRNA(Phe)-imidazoG37] synthetase (radical SAM superfamily)
LTDIPVVLLTNGSLFFRKDIREAACNADIVIPSLDAGNERTFAAVNRPHPEISFQSMVDGICRFREEFRGNLWLEILFIEGFNTKDSELTALKSYADRIAPEIIHLNTIDRYPAELYAKKVRIDIMNEIATFFGENAQII